MSDKKDKNQEAVINDEKLEKRRKALKNILAGSGTVVTAAAMQDKWAKPVIESVVLPAHAQTSGLAGSFVSSNQNQGQNDNDLLDVLVPTANAVCVFELCINVGENGSVNIQCIDGSPTVATGTGNLESFASGISLTNGKTITGTMTGVAPNRVINGQYTGNCNSGDYDTVPEAPGTCSLTGSTTYNPSTTQNPNTTQNQNTTRNQNTTQNQNTSGNQ